MKTLEPRSIPFVSKGLTCWTVQCQVLCFSLSSEQGLLLQDISRFGI